MKKNSEKKPFYVNRDGEPRCVGCDDSARYMKINIESAVVSFIVTADGEMLDQEWDYGKVSLVCDCGVEVQGDAFEWKRIDNGRWKLNIKKDSIERLYPPEA